MQIAILLRALDWKIRMVLSMSFLRLKGISMFFRPFPPQFASFWLHFFLLLYLQLSLLLLVNQLHLRLVYFFVVPVDDEMPLAIGAFCQSQWG